MTPLFLAASIARAGCGPQGCPPPTEAPAIEPAAATAPIPPIDRDRPARTEVATFALG